MQLEADGLVVGRVQLRLLRGSRYGCRSEGHHGAALDIEKKALAHRLARQRRWEAKSASFYAAKLDPVVANTQSRNRELREERHRRFTMPSLWPALAMAAAILEILSVQSQRHEPCPCCRAKPGRVDHRALMEVVLARDVPRPMRH
jgi:hypothetical protein